MQFLETELTDWKDIFRINNTFLSQFLFRGQANKEWKLTSSIERLVDRLHPILVDKAVIALQEKSMIQEFQWKFQIFENSNIPDANYIEWLSIMQHYGASTRLLDFTDSFFVATFMALSESFCDSSIWAINNHIITSDTLDLFRKEFPKNSVSKKEIDEYSLELANKAIDNSLTESEQKLLLIRPKKCNERIYRQQGLFLMPTNIQRPFMDNLSPFLNNKESQNIHFEEIIELSQNNFR
ncbi:FRG domain-containing protein [Salinimicrobium tongyeongense]|uniref:FRG domain-containing protein n=1 Tax=Salinimicrobium tongyeongense TaxID=2809707 RepID=A0ABY6NPR6_9FLAO|nr:FRG domain-containing protein [Salinimicrobium tongyeongense]UZH54862.1 FRG domain-containing protein [Salinimicrobium tongyeongense]